VSWLCKLSSTDHLARLRCGEELAERWHDAPVEVEATLREALLSGNANSMSEASRVASQVGANELMAPLCEIAANPRLAGRARKAAVLALGVLGNASAVPKVCSLLNHPSPMYRRAAVEALGRIGTEHAINALVAALEDPAWQVRMNAAIGLSGAQTRVPEVAARLIAILAIEPHAATREQLARALAELAHRDRNLIAEVSALFIGWLEQGEHVELMRAGARGLGELGCKDAAAVLAVAAESEQSTVAEEAQWSLVHLGLHAALQV